MSNEKKDLEKQQDTKPAKESKQDAPKDAKPEQAKKPKNRKKLKYGALATGITAVFIAAVVLVNVVVSVVMDRYPLKVDLTSSKLYEISQDSIDYVKNLSKDVKILVLAEESYFTTNNYMKIVPETLDKYRQNSNGHISVEYYNMVNHPEITSEYKQYYSGEFQEGDVIVACGDRVKVLDFGDIIKTEQTPDYTTYTYKTSYTFVGEQSLTSAIMSVTDANPKKVAFVQTAGTNSIYADTNKYSVAALHDLLDKNGYDITDVDLLNDNILPTDYDLVVLPAPYNDLTEAMVTKLSDFLYNEGGLNKDMFYIADVKQGNTPNLDAFLAEWGVSVGDAIVYEGNSSQAQYVSTALGTLTAPNVVMAESDYGAQLSNTSRPIVAPLARPIRLLFESNTDRQTLALLQTSETAFLYPLNTKQDTASDSTDVPVTSQEAASTTATSFDIENAEKGVQNLMTITTKSNAVNEDVNSSQLMVMSSCSMLDYYVAQSASYNNAEYVVSAINVMVGKENGIVIANKALEQTNITITEGQLSGLRTLVIVVIPLIVVVIGLVVFVRRRNR